MKIIIQVNGGIVQQVYIVNRKNKKIEKCIVVDFDDDINSKTTIVNEDLYAYVGEIPSITMPSKCDVKMILKQYNHDQRKEY
jgi:hypothetical protein